MAAVSTPPLLGPGLVVRRVRVKAKDVVFVKGVLEASEGLGALFAEHGGEIALSAPESRAAELDRLIADLSRELWMELDEPACVAPPQPGD